MRTILNYKPLPLLLAAAALALAASACGEDDAGDGGEASVTVVATTTHLADFARNVGGDRAEVVGLLAPNSDPHDYEPRPSDVGAIAESDLVLQSGGDLDLWLDDVVDSSGTDAPVVELIDSVETIEGGHAHADEDEHAGEAEDEHAEAAEDEHADEAEEEHAGEEETEDEHADEEEADPHWWHDPRNVVRAVEAIRDELIAVDPDGRETYEANAAAYVEEVEDLDRVAAGCLGEIPASRRKLVTSHDALGYLADRYEIEVVGAAIPALTTQAQPSAGETDELIELIREERVAAVFPEAGLGDDLQRSLAGATGAAVGGELWADTLGPEGSGAETYLEAAAANAVTLVEGFSDSSEACVIAVSDSGSE